MRIFFTKHAELKFEILKEHGFKITKRQIKDVINTPESVMQGRKGRLIAQRAISETHVIRVIYDREGDLIKVITFYPTRR